MTGLSSQSDFGRYRLLGRISVGGMAEIFHARIRGALGFEKPLAIKRILPQYARDPDFLRMFVAEAKLVCHLVHPNIVQVFELGEADGHYFIAMEYVDGLDAGRIFSTLAARRQRLPGVLALYIVGEALKGLDYAHRAVGPEGRLLGVVHRDVSPANILVSTRGDVKIGDFGVALVRHGLADDRGAFKGKYGYMSPEQVAGVQVDQRSDIFAAGVVLAELLLGRRLFLGDNDLQTLDNVMHVRAPALERHAGALPPEVVRMLRLALQRDPARRYQSARDFYEDIATFLDDYPHRVDAEAMAGFLGAHVMAAGGAEGDGPGPVAGGDADAATPAPTVLGDLTPDLEEPNPQGERFGAVAVPRVPLAESTGELSLADDDPAAEPPAALARRRGGRGGAGKPGGGEGGEDPAAPPPEPAAVDGTGRQGVVPVVMLSERLPPVDDVRERMDPDFSGSLAQRTMTKVLFRFTLAEESGLLTVSGAPHRGTTLLEMLGCVEEIVTRAWGTPPGGPGGGQTCEVLLDRGTPRLVCADRGETDLVAFLVEREVIQLEDVERAASRTRPDDGLVRRLVRDGLVAPLQVARYVTAAVLERVLETFAWADGEFAFCRDLPLSGEAFPTGLDALAFISRGVAAIPDVRLDAYFAGIANRRLRPAADPSVELDELRPDEVMCGMHAALARGRTVAETIADCFALGPLLHVKRALYALIECELAEVEGMADPDGD